MSRTALATRAPAPTTPEVATCSKEEALEMHKELLAANSDYKVSRAKLFECIWRVDQHKIWLKLGYATAEEYLRVKFPNETLGNTTYREGKRIWGQFLNQISKIKEIGGDQDKAEDYAKKMVPKLLESLGGNTAFLGDVARYDIMGNSKHDAESNMGIVKGIAANSQNFRDFKQKVASKFSAMNQNRVVAAGKRHGTVSAGGAPINLMSILIKPTAVDMPVIKQAFENISLEIGSKKGYDEMSSQELGSHLYLMSTRINSDPESVARLRTQGEKKQMAIALIRRAYNVTSGADIPADKLRQCVERFAQVMEEVVSDE